MALVRFELVQREGEGLLPCRARDPEGRAWRLLAGGAHLDARWIGTHEGQAIWGIRDLERDGERGTGEFLEVDERLDDDATDLGPEGTGEGLFDRTGSEASASGDITGALAVGTGAHRRTAVLAWIAATADGEGHDAASLGPGTSALRRLFEGEPLDLLPPLDPGLPPPPPPPPPPPLVDAPPPAVVVDLERLPRSVSWLLAVLLLAVALWIVFGSG